MKKISHPDYWVEIPSGEFPAGLSLQQRWDIVSRFKDGLAYNELPAESQVLVNSGLSKLVQPWPVNFTLEEEKFKFKTTWVYKPKEQWPSSLSSSDLAIAEIILEKLRQDHESSLTREEIISLAKAEGGYWGSESETQIHDIQARLRNTNLQQIIHVDRFYISRFAITQGQYHSLKNHMLADQVNGALEEPSMQTLNGSESKIVEGALKMMKRDKLEIPGRGVAYVQLDAVRDICCANDWRLPTHLEWEKAARGVNGYLYPWGNKWDSNAGYFEFSQWNNRQDIENVDAFPLGVSPYGVWGMEGNCAELVTKSKRESYFYDKPYTDDDKTIYINEMGSRPKESSKYTAWFDYIIPIQGNSRAVSFRPVLDKWPTQQWQGFSTEEKGNE